MKNVTITAQRRTIISSFVATLLASTSTAAFSQTPEQGSVLDEIIVTAQQSSQNLQDVPISVTAFSAEDIERARINEIADYAMATPNIQSTNFGNRSRSFLAIRGVTSFGGAVPYGIYVDGLNVVPGRLTRGLDQDLQDIAQIEILRGPQGTYFGRNTMAGAVNITSVKPEFEAMSATITADASSFDTYMGRALVNLPLSDTFAARVIAFGETSDGFIKNVGSGPGNGYESLGGRVSLRGQLSPALEMNLSLSVDSNESDNFNAIPTGVFSPQLASGIAQINGAINGFGLPLETFPTVSSDLLFPQTRDTVSNDLGVESDNDSLIASARFDYQGEGYTLTSITGFVDTNYDEFGEEDFTNQNLITNLEGNQVESISQELRANFDINEQLQLIVGGLYASDDTTSENERLVVAGNSYNSLPAPFPALLDTRLINASNTFFEEVESRALFGEFIYTPSPQWEMRLGGRYTSDKVESGRTNRLAANPVQVSREDTFDAFTPRLAVSYYPNEETTLYGLVSAGYKVGGFNFSANPAVPEAFDEESAVNYELGAKFDFANGRARLNLAGFYFDWDDVQVQGFDIAAGTSFIQNAGKAHSTGFEAELSAALTDEFQISAALGWLESEFDEFDNAINSRTGQIVPDASGTAIPAAPEWNLSLSALYERPLTERLEGFAEVSYRYTSDHFFSPLEENPIEAYNLVNASIGVTTDSFRLAFYADNLFDEDYFVGYKQGIHLNGDLIVVGEPTRWGVRVTKSFG